MATIEQFQDALAAIDAATNDIAAELARLREIIVGAGISSADEDLILAGLDDAIHRLQALGQPPV